MRGLAQYAECCGTVKDEDGNVIAYIPTGAAAYAYVLVEARAMLRCLELLANAFGFSEGCDCGGVEDDENNQCVQCLTLRVIKRAKRGLE